MACSGSCAVNFVPATQRHIKATLKDHHSIVLSLYTHTSTCHMSTHKPRLQPQRSRPPTWRIEYHVRLSLHHSTPSFILKSLLQWQCLSWNLSSTRIWQHRLLVWYTNRPLYLRPGVGRGESDLLTPAIIPWITGTEPPDSLNCCFLFADICCMLLTFASEATRGLYIRV